MGIRLPVSCRLAQRVRIECLLLFCCIASCRRLVLFIDEPVGGLKFGFGPCGPLQRFERAGCLRSATTMPEGRQTRRVIWPIQLSFMDNARVVTGWCELRKAFRFFRTDGISSVEICDRYPARRADLIRDFYVQLSDVGSEAKPPDRN